jgi:hypothetical protein
MLHGFIDLSEIERLYATGLTIRELASLFDTSDEYPP